MITLVKLDSRKRRVKLFMLLNKNLGDAVMDGFRGLEDMAPRLKGHWADAAAAILPDLAGLQSSNWKDRFRESC